MSGKKVKMIPDDKIHNITSAGHGTNGDIEEIRVEHKQAKEYEKKKFQKEIEQIFNG